MPPTHRSCRPFGGALVLLATSGCGLIDQGGEARPAASWCEEEGVGDVAEVELTQNEVEGVLRDFVLTLRDADGRTLVKVYFPRSGPPDVVGATHAGWRDEYTLDAAGNVIESRRDDALDGVVDAISTRTYDEMGRPTAILTDFDGDGTVDGIETWDYGAPLLSLHSYDEDADGDADRIDTSTYSESGVLIREEHDSNADGAIERTSTYSHDESGLLVESTVVDTVTTMSETVTYEYDERDRLIAVVRTYEGSSNVTATEETYEYDDQDRLVRTVRIVDDAFGPEATEETYAYDDAGRLAEVVTTLVANGFQEIRRMTYDDAGRLVREETRDLGGALREAQEYEYDGSELVRRSTDSDGDGSSNWVTTWTACD